MMRGAQAIVGIIVSLPILASEGGMKPVEPNDLDLLLDAIARVESGNDAEAVGDGGRALGVYQIHRAYWEDGTRFLGVEWDYEQAKDPASARAVVQAYLLRYGRGCTLLEMARIHNGGPNGHRKQQTAGYARRIASVLRDSGESAGSGRWSR